MDTNDQNDFLNDSDDLEQMEDFLNTGKRRKRFPSRSSKRPSKEARAFVAAQDDSRHNFRFTYKAARFEEWWLLDSLGDFYEHKWICDVLSRIKGGKEASVYLCRSGSAVKAPLLAAKVYRPRSLRNLKSDAQYRVGRTDIDESGNAIIDEGDVRALAKRTKYGEELRHQSWISYEYQTLEVLHASGADVPAPYAIAKNAILMDYVGDARRPAPVLNSESLDLREARTLFERVIRNVDLMLRHDRIHGDLSAYNILYWKGQITLIDFPQVVMVRSNPAAWVIFLRDMTRVGQYFSLQGVEADARQLAVELWTSHGLKIGREVHPRDLDADKAEDRKLWESQKAN